MFFEVYQQFYRLCFKNFKTLQINLNQNNIKEQQRMSILQVTIYSNGSNTTKDSSVETWYYNRDECAKRGMCKKRYNRY